MSFLVVYPIGSLERLVDHSYSLEDLSAHTMAPQSTQLFQPHGPLGPVGRRLS